MMKEQRLFKLVKRALMLMLVLSFLGCANKVLHSDAMPDDARQDYVYLLEKLNDGKLAMWKASDGMKHQFAVFSTYPEKDRLCRDYFSFTVAAGRESNRTYGTSCRAANKTWHYVEGSEHTSQRHYQQFMRLESGFYQYQRPSRPQQQTGTVPKGIAYPGSYTLSPFFSSTSKKAEGKYGIPLRSMIDRTSRQQDFHPCLIHSMVYYESGYNPNAATSCCSGLMQLGKAAAKETNVRNRKDPQQSLNGGARYLQQKLNEPGINKNISLALASYNCGYGTIKKNNFKIPRRCWSNNPQQYVQKILGKFQQCN